MSEWKETSIGLIPSDWDYESIGPCIDLLTGPAFDSSRFVEDHSCIRLARGINVTKGHFRWDEKITLRWPNVTPDLERYILREGDVIIGMDGSLVGRNFATVTSNDVPSLLVQRVACLRTSASLDSAFLYYFIASDFWLSHVDVVKTHSGIPHISNGDIRNFRISFPPLTEQRKIARILTTVDNLIEQTEALIEKYKSIKQGMMHDLFTRGVDQSGRLRPPYEDAPELYKESELGFDALPINWEEGTIADFCDLHNSLRFPMSAEVRSTMQGQYPYYGPTGILDYINEYRIQGRFVLIGEDGDHFLKFDRQKMTIAIEGRCNVNNHAHILSGRNGCTTAWVDACFSHRDITLHLTQQGAGRLKLNKSSLLEMPMLVPPEPEQQAICRRLCGITQRIQLEKFGLAKLRTLKSGLMQDLLTGKVRVSVDETEEVTANV